MTLGDRVLRFVSTSLLLHAVFAWPLYLAWRVSFHPPGMVTTGRFASMFAERPDGFFRVLLPDGEFVVGRPFARARYEATGS